MFVIFCYYEDNDKFDAHVVVFLCVFFVCFFCLFFFFLTFTLYSPRHLTYRGLGRVISLHALQTTIKASFMVVVSLAHPFHAPFMQFQKQF